MEIYSGTTRFCLACNNSAKIIEPIQSRCAILRYSKLNDKQLLKRLLELCELENVSYTDDGLEAIIFTAQGRLSLYTRDLLVIFVTLPKLLLAYRFTSTL